MKFLIYDFEVFKYNCLFGAIIVEKIGTKYFQTWDKEKIKDFYHENIGNLWVGHNNIGYDNLILEAVLQNIDPYKRSKMVINKEYREKADLSILSYDLMGSVYYSIKMVEAVLGKDISESPVNFDIDRPLTSEEKELVEKYNRDDLDQTLENFFDKENFGNFRIKQEFIKLFHLDKEAINYTGAKLSEIVLRAKKTPGIEEQYIAPPIYENLELENEDLLNFYRTEGFRNGQKATIHIGNADIIIGSGGAHSAEKKCYFPKALYFDVSGYYNLTMLNYDLLPRSIDQYGRDLYREIYYKQLEYKKTDPAKRAPLKIILLSAFGAEMAPYNKLYDPQKGTLVTITGQLFICDLLEKLKDLVIIVQTNTDGIIIVPKNWEDEKKIIHIVELWEERTGYTIKKDHIFDLFQRDVNNYMYKDDKGRIHCRGEALKQYEAGERVFFEGKPNLDFKEPIIISHCIVEFLMNGISPEETVEKYKKNLRYFQYICKKKSFDYTQWEVTDLNGNCVKERLQGVNRVFAWNNKELSGMVYKYKQNKDKLSRSKISNLPDSVFVYDKEILSDNIVKKLSSEVDYKYYIYRSYERIEEFLPNE